MSLNNQGVIYLLHFSEAFSHARHYVGFTDDLAARLERHRAGHGSKLVAAVIRAGITVEAVRTWQGSRADERAPVSTLARRRGMPQSGKATNSLRPIK